MMEFDLFKPSLMFHPSPRLRSRKVLIYLGSIKLSCKWDGPLALLFRDNKGTNGWFSWMAPYLRKMKTKNDAGSLKVYPYGTIV